MKKFWQIFLMDKIILIKIICMTLNPREAWQEAMKQLPELKSNSKYKLWPYDKVDMIINQRTREIILSRRIIWVKDAVSIVMRKVWNDSIEFSTRE